MSYYTIIIPPVPVAYQTEWHGPEPLSRGAFVTMGDAIDWARTHLGGTPYSIRFVS